jgi:hypothetical protein
MADNELDSQEMESEEENNIRSKMRNPTGEPPSRTDLKRSATCDKA